MGIQSDYTVGLAKEATYGTYVAPSRFFEGEASLKESVETTQGTGQRPGMRVARADRRVIVKRTTEGEITLDAPTVGLGFFLDAFFGVCASTKVGTTAVYQQVHTMKRADFANSYTVQQGIPRLGSSTTDVYTYTGAQCSTLSLEASDGEIVKITTGWIARALSLTQAGATPSYPAALDLFTFVGGGLCVGPGALVAPTTTAPATLPGPPLAVVRSVKVDLDNGLDEEGFGLGSGGLRSRPAAYTGGKDDAIGGSFEIEYTGRDLVDAYLAQTPLSLVLNFEGPAEIAAGEKPLLQIVIPAIKLDGDLPTGNGGEVITVEHEFTGLQGAAPEPVYAVYRSLDTAV